MTDCFFAPPYAAGMCALISWRALSPSTLVSSSWRGNDFNRPRSAGRSCRCVGWEVSKGRQAVALGVEGETVGVGWCSRSV